MFFLETSPYCCCSSILHLWWLLNMVIFCGKFWVLLVCRTNKHQEDVIFVQSIWQFYIFRFRLLSTRLFSYFCCSCQTLLSCDKCPRLNVIRSICLDLNKHVRTCVVSAYSEARYVVLARQGRARSTIWKQLERLNTESCTGYRQAHARSMRPLGLVRLET